MPRIDSEKFYTSAINVHGVTPRGVNWASKETQEIRFKVLLDMLPDDISNLTIADAGCGFGDFYLYMTKKKKVPKEYIGIDSLTDMYSIASERTGCEILIADICKDKLPPADYYVCSGAMNVLNVFETHLFIRNCFEATKRGFIFNILHGEKKSETYNYFTKKQIKQIATRFGVKSMKTKENYLEDDITVEFTKDVN